MFLSVRPERFKKDAGIVIFFQRRNKCVLFCFRLERILLRNILQSVSLSFGIEKHNKNSSKLGY